MAFLQGVRSSAFPPLDHDSVTCWGVALMGAKPVRSSPCWALDHDEMRLHLAVAEGARSTGRTCSRDHSPTVKTAQIAAPTGQMVRAERLESKEFGRNWPPKLQLVRVGAMYQ